MACWPESASVAASAHPGKPGTAMLAPNDTWCADFKGQFKTGDGIYCYPLSLTDGGFSRYLLGCQGLPSTSVAESKPVFTRLFKEFGLPKRIRTDNGGAVRRHDVGSFIQSLRVVGSPRRTAGTHRTGQTPAERPARTHASNPQSGSRPPAGRQSSRPATQVQRLPPRIQ